MNAQQVGDKLQAIVGGATFPDMERRFGAFADMGPWGDEGAVAYFATAEEATAAARAYWAALTEEERPAVDIYAGEINLHKATHGTLAGRLVWDTVAICYDAKDEERRAILAQLEDAEVDA